MILVSINIEMEDILSAFPHSKVDGHTITCPISSDVTATVILSDEDQEIFAWDSKDREIKTLRAYFYALDAYSHAL